jgi:hypothetical protein
VAIGGAIVYVFAGRRPSRYGLRNSSGSLAMFTAIRQSRVNYFAAVAPAQRARRRALPTHCLTKQGPRLGRMYAGRGLN